MSKSRVSAKAKQIRIACKGSRTARLDGLEIIQDDLKELSEQNYGKLRKRIEEKGFDAPIFVWGDKILDGTQRVRVLREMVKKGWKLPNGKIPVCDIKATSLNDAKDRLLGYVSQYGKLSEDGLYEFIHSAESLDLTTLDLPDFNWKLFEKAFLQDEEPASEANIQIPEQQHSIIIECEDEAQQQTLFERFQGEGLKCRLLTL